MRRRNFEVWGTAHGNWMFTRARLVRFFHSERCSVNEIAEYCELSKPSVLRILNKARP